MEPNKKKIVDLGILETDEVSGVKKISLVEEPAIMLDFHYFNTQKFVHPSAGEHHDEFISRCIPVLINEGKKNDQAVAVCEAYWSEKMAGVKVSFDYDDTLSTARGKELAAKAIADGEDVYIISARNDKEGMLSTAKDLGIDASKVFATGSNKAKIEKIKELDIKKHYDNNKDVTDEIGAIGVKFQFKEVTCVQCDWSWDTEDGGLDPYMCHDCGMDNTPNIEKFESYNDYPESAKNAAKRALEFRDSHPEISCGTPVGWARANQLSKGENISEETIARMASFARQLQYKDVPYTEGCGGLMVDAWGGQTGIEWASNKLKEIRGENFDAVQDTEMVNGIIDIILQVDDIENRKEIAKEMIKSFDEEGVIYDLTSFIKAIGLNIMDFNIDVTALPPYVDQNPKKQKPIEVINWSKDEYTVETIIGLAKELGIKEADLSNLFKQKFATANPIGISNGDIEGAVIADNRNELRLYKYEGGLSDNSRSFCVQMLQLDLYYTEESIKAMSDVAYNPGLGPRGSNTYSIWEFKGGANCQHFWAKFNAYQKVNGDVKLQRVGPVAGRAGKRPENMPNNGYLTARHAASFNFASEEQQILVGPAMVPDMNILRVDENGQRYYVKFSPETIKEIALKYFKEGRVHELNTDHEENTAGAYIFESWLVETLDDKANTLYGYNLPIGSWCISVKVDDPETWRRVKAGELRGFSIEGILVDMEELEAMKTYEKIKKILGTDI